MSNGKSFLAAPTAAPTTAAPTVEFVHDETTVAVWDSLVAHRAPQVWLIVIVTTNCPHILYAVSRPSLVVKALRLFSVNRPPRRAFNQLTKC